MSEPSVFSGPLTRRRMLAWLPAGLAFFWSTLAAADGQQAGQAAGQPGFFARHHRRKVQAPPPQPLVYFGTDTSKPGAKGIYVARFNTLTGQLSQPTLASTSPHDAYLATGFAGSSTARRILYATNEADEARSTVSSFSVDSASGALQPIGQVPSGGAGPCYISIHPNGRWAYVANYAGGTVAGFSIRPDGSLNPPGDVINFHQGTKFGKNGPVAARQDGPHPHSATLSPDGRFLVVNDLGRDDIAIFPVNQLDGRLGPANVVSNRMAGAGPRHIVFHPNGHWVYGIDELSSHIDQYLWSETQGSGENPGQAILSDTGNSVSTLASDFHGTNTAAEIAISLEGTFIYASNRGEDSLVVFSVDATTGALTFVQRISCGGQMPRQFTLSGAGNWLLCGNQGSGSVTVFARDGVTGRLSGPVQTLPVPAPMMTLMV
jgi:6-phosphogluconolactonase